MKKQKVMAIFGTRPEAIKMAPVIAELSKYSDEIELRVVVTAQHRSMLDQVLDIFMIKPDYDLDIMLPGQSLTEITVRTLSRLERVMQEERPDLVLVQGDTTTAFVGGLASFYLKIPIGHIEAGLRTSDKYNPYPEELNRHLIDAMSDICFAPTLTARHALLHEGTPEDRILVTGNTVIDALLVTASQNRGFTLPALKEIPFGPARKTVLVTSHRRENLGAPLEGICFALRELLLSREDLQIVFPVHLNPQVRSTVWSVLADIDRAWLIDPLDYVDFVQVMMRSHIVVTDSGGVQEEAPALGAPVLVIRTTTERPEAIEAGTAQLIGTDPGNIISAVSLLLDDSVEYARMQHAVNPYGDGLAARRTVHAIRHFFGLVPGLPVPFGEQRLPDSEETAGELRVATYAAC